VEINTLLGLGKENPDYVPPTLPHSPPLKPEEVKKQLGEDFFELKPTQQEDRKKEGGYSRKKIFFHCLQEFQYDKNLRIFRRGKRSGN